MATRTYGRWLTGCQSCLRLDKPSGYRHERPNVNRMKALMFLLGMFDSVNSCYVGETEAHSIMRHQEVRNAMQSR